MSLHPVSVTTTIPHMPTIPEALNVALQHHQAGQLQAAENIYRQILKFEPNHPDALHLMGVFLAQTGRLTEAEDHLQRAVAFSPNFAPFHCSLGNVLQSLGKLEEAVASYQQALRLRPDSAEAHNNLGNALQKQGQLEAAVASYQKALQHRPDYFEACCNLGNAFRSQGRFPEAIIQFRRAIQLNSNYAIAHHDLGTVLQTQGQSEFAVLSYRQALRLKPDYFSAYYNLGVTLKALGRDEEAGVVWQEWLKHEPQNPIAQHMVAATTGQNVPTRSSDEFLRLTFDGFAANFDEKLRALGYCGPELILEAVSAAVGAPAGALDILDAGCGTGLCGPLLRPYARQLTGVDLSPGMLRQAYKRGGYDELIISELTAHLESVEQAYDLIATADTLNYLGDLRPVFVAAARSLRPGGWLMMTLEQAATNEGTYKLQPQGRYCHTEQYVRHSLRDAGFTVIALKAADLRMEAKQPVHAMVVSARRANP